MDVNFYEDRRGKQPAEEYLRAIHNAGDKSAMASYDHGTELLEKHGPALPSPTADLINKAKRLYELRFGNHRIGYIEHGGCIVLLHGWRKQTKKLDKQEEARASRNADDWRARFP